MFALFILPFMTIIYIIVFCFVGHWKYKNFGSFLFKGTTNSFIIKLVCLISLSLSFLYSSFLWKISSNLGMFYKTRGIFFFSNVLFEVQHSLNLPLVFLSNLVLLVALLISWNSLTSFAFLPLIYVISGLCLTLAFTTNSLFLFLLVFEILALLIFILMAYSGSARCEKAKASYFFLFFTFYGSITLILLFTNQYALYQINFIGDLSFSSNNPLQWLLLFTALAIKVPIFPLHIWLPYAHVEASTSTSVILAALMLKLGGYGLIRFLLPAFSIEVHLFFRPFVIFISLISIIYSSIIMLRQLDLKRQIAFSSIAHMGLAVIGVFTFVDVGIRGAVYMMISHGLISSLMFFLAGVLSDRFHTRNIALYSGLISNMPLFSCFFIFASLANIGFPGTSGFLSELFILLAVASTSHSTLLVVIIGMLIMTGSTLVLILRILFGNVRASYFISTQADLSRLEFVIAASLTSFIVGFGFVDILY